ncbi:ribosome maturation factor RimP [Allobranchiibius sp. GilTou73]|uniref:ribosome maturation factor RimP n=1 Tax=Allobranchiibius sp. GilTou73 TaxID=2904523 RepID=UPI001F28EEE5|nr:ribosome maturation factor RimP [Allobranchiibius sp. GilTou73]UIJ34416.1 ribosome maturation factor RimP [Allobranchiibius sp. GilTou73]
MDPSKGSTERSRHIVAVLSPVVARSGMTIEDITVTPAGKRRLVRVLVDRDVTVDDADRESPVEPLSLDEVGEVTRAVSDALDESDAMGEAAYVLEVSSPGTDRPLHAPQHFRRNVGRLIALTTTGEEQLTGRLTAAGTDSFDLADDTGATRTFGYAESSRARVELEFNRPTTADVTEEQD